MRRSSLIMLVAAILLGLAAVFFARMFLLNREGEQQTTQNVQTVSAVVAAQPFAFGEKIVPEKLNCRLARQWPAARQFSAHCRCSWHRR